VELPDERKRPTVREAEVDSEALVGAGAPTSARARPPHDPTHPQGGPRAIGTGKAAPQRVSPPSAAGTTRIPTAASAPTAEPPTTRLPTPAAADQTTRLTVPVEPATKRTPRAEPSRVTPRGPAPSRGSAPARGSSANGSREIESWLGDLRGGATGSTPPTGDAKRPPQRRQPPAPAGAEPPTTAIPTQRPADADATEKIDTREAAEDNPKRRGGGVSAADLLRREGRL
jgi:RND superfamily putative drug exporter